MPMNNLTLTWPQRFLLITGADVSRLLREIRRKITSAVPGTRQTLELTLRGNTGKWEKCCLTVETTAHIGFQRGDLFRREFVHATHSM